MNQQEAPKMSMVKGAFENASNVKVIGFLTLLVTLVAFIVAVTLWVQAGKREEQMALVTDAELHFLDALVSRHVAQHSKPPEKLPSPPREPSRAEQRPRDPWGNDYIYRTSGDDTWVVFSVGPDGVEGTEDDIYPSSDFD